MRFWRLGETNGIKQLSLILLKMILFPDALFPGFLRPTTPRVPITLRQQRDSLADGIFSFSIDIDRAQAVQSGEDVGK